MNFQWDSKKSKSNLKKHKVSFDEAASIFENTYFEQADDSSDEERFKAIGFSKKANVLVVVYCYRDEEEQEIRIISARKATKHEEQEFTKHTKKIN